MKILLILSFLLSFNVYAENVLQFQFGKSITNHTFVNEDTEKLSNKLTSNGKYVHNTRGNISYLSIDRETSGYSKFSFILGKDCLDSDVYGASFSFGFHSENNHQLGFLLGFYQLDEDVWEERGITKYWLNDGTVPLVGFEIQFELLEINDNLKINQHNLLSPWITNHGFFITLEF